MELQDQFRDLITEKSRAIAEQAVELQYQADPEYWKRFGDEGRRLSVRDVEYHLPFLVEAVVSDDTDVFKSYISWVKQLFRGLNFSDRVMLQTLDCMGSAMHSLLPPEYSPLFKPVLEAGKRQMEVEVGEPESFIDESTPMGQLAAKYTAFLISGNRREASRLVMNAVESGIPIKEIYLDLFQVSQYEIGRLWLMNKISVATEHFCSAATQTIMSQLYPYVFDTPRTGHKMVGACIGGELHEIGMRMVSDFFEMEGWDTWYLGANTPSTSIVRTVEERGADLVGLSVSMPYHRPLLRETIDTLRNNNTTSSVVVLVGGNAFNQSNNNSWKQYGADGYAPNAQTAVTLATRIRDTKH